MYLNKYIKREGRQQWNLKSIEKLNTQMDNGHHCFIIHKNRGLTPNLQHLA